MSSDNPKFRPFLVRGITVGKPKHDLQLSLDNIKSSTAAQKLVARLSNHITFEVGQRIMFDVSEVTKLYRHQACYNEKVIDALETAIARYPEIPSFNVRVAFNLIKDSLTVDNQNEENADDTSATPGAGASPGR